MGGGIVGCSIAFYLAKAGVRPLVLEKTSIAAEASSGGAGLLSAQAHTNERGALFDLKLASRTLYADLADELRERTEMDIEYRKIGHVVPAFSADAAAAVRARVAWQRADGLPAQWLTTVEAREIEPGLPAGIHGAGWFPEDNHINNTAATQALAGAVARMGGALRVECPVADLVRDGDRIAGVRTAREIISAAEVVLAAGAWTGQFEAAAGIPLPVFPAKGQIVVARLPEAATRHVVYEDVYVIPRATGEHIIGSTVEYVGFDKRVTLEAIAGLLGEATKLVPTLRDAEMVATYGCLRPASADGLPLLGRVTGRPGLVVATGHFRNGILLAPITGVLIADLIAKGRTNIPLAPFRPDRPLPPSPSPTG